MDIKKYIAGSIALRDLPAWSPWPERLLGLTDWKTITRDTAKVDAEYDKDKYARCLNFAIRHPDATPESVRAFEFGMSNRKSFCISLGDELAELPVVNIHELNTEFLLDAVEPFIGGVDTVIELGCGYGTNLWEIHKRFPEKRYIGGEYSANAVELSRRLYTPHPRISVEQFNFYHASYPMFGRLPAKAKVLVLTRHAIEQLPSARNVVETLLKYKEKLACVVHLEIVSENLGGSLLDLLRKRYVAVNDYNCDLLGLLSACPEVEIVRNDPHVLGLNPLNPTSVLAWKTR